MIRYAIRKRWTNEYMPQRTDTASSALKPREGCNPRLWRRPRDARAFLTAWCKGGAYLNYETEEEGFGPFKVAKGLEYLADTQRDKEDYEIVEIRLTVTKGVPIQ